MTIDDRLEALTQSVELLASMHRETERLQQQTQRIVGELAESMKRLANIAATMRIAWMSTTTGSTGAACSRCLKFQPRAQLEIPIVLRAADGAAADDVHAILRQVEVRMIRQVERLHPELQRRAIR